MGVGVGVGADVGVGVGADVGLGVGADVGVGVGADVGVGVGADVGSGVGVDFGVRADTEPCVGAGSVAFGFAVAAGTTTAFEDTPVFASAISFPCFSAAIQVRRTTMARDIAPISTQIHRFFFGSLFAG